MRRFFDSSQTFSPSLNGLDCLIVLCVILRHASSCAVSTSSQAVFSSLRGSSAAGAFVAFVMGGSAMGLTPYIR